MPKLREDVSEFELPGAEEDGVQSESATEDGEPTGRRKRKKIYIPLNEDGSIFEQRFKAEDRAALESLLGRGGVSSSAAQFKVDLDSIPILYDGVAMALRQVGKMFFKWPEQFTQYLNYSPEQKERLKEPTAKVIEKFAPAWLMKHQEVVFLAMAFGQCTQEMVTNAAAAYAQDMASRPPQPASVVKPQE